MRLAEEAKAKAKVRLSLPPFFSPFSPFSRLVLHQTSYVSLPLLHHRLSTADSREGNERQRSLFEVRACFGISVGVEAGHGRQGRG